MAVAVPGCTDLDEPATSSTSSAGMLNGMLNGLHHPEGLTKYLQSHCPQLAQRLLGSGDLTASFAPSFATEIHQPACREYMFYTAQLMVPWGQTLTLYAAGAPAATFTGVMGLQHLVAQVYPGYTFALRSFGAAYVIARIIVTQGYAALTNGIGRTVSYKTKEPELDAHRASIEDFWPREFTQLVPFSAQAFAAMQSDPGFLARLPNFFRECDPLTTNYSYMQGACPTVIGTALTAQPIKMCVEPPPVTPGFCSVPIVVHGDTTYNTTDIIPGRSCRILEDGEEPPPETWMVVGDVAVPYGGCPLIWYRGRTPGAWIYDDRAYNNAVAGNDGCDRIGPTNLVNCVFNIMQSGQMIPNAFLEHWAFNVAPI